ncbi:MAG: hypothetical protein PHD86_09825 [Kiritimatiellae bacterium]|nr:hypothetical protein [Kiritimatiellia bacterium]
MEDPRDLVSRVIKVGLRMGQAASSLGPDLPLRRDKPAGGEVPAPSAGKGGKDGPRLPLKTDVPTGEGGSRPFTPPLRRETG